MFIDGLCHEIEGTSYVLGFCQYACSRRQREAYGNTQCTYHKCCLGHWS